MSEVVEQFKQELEKTKKAIDERIAKADEQAKNAGTIADDVKNQLANLAKKYNEVSDLSQKQQEHLDKVQAEIQKGGIGSGEAKKSFSDLLESKLKDTFKDGKVQKSQNLLHEINTKAPGDMSITASTTGRVAQFEHIPGIKAIMPRINHIREFMRIGSTSSTSVDYTVETGGEGDPTPLGEGVIKPLIDFDYENKVAPVKKIAGRMVISEEMLNDIPELANHVSSRGVEKLLIVEDAQLLTGAGTGDNITGLSINADTATAFGYTVTAPQKWDVLGACAYKLVSNNYMASAMMINPVDFAEMTLLKDTQNRYLAPIIWTNGVPTIYGIPIGVTNAIAAGSFIIGDFVNGAEMKQRAGIGTRFLDQTLAANNQVLVLVEERFALPIFYPLSFIYDTFADGIAALTAP